MSRTKQYKKVVKQQKLSLGVKIKEFGEEKFETVVSFSEATGKSTTDLYRYFNGKVVPGADFILRLKQLGCDINWLLSDDNTSNVSKSGNNPTIRMLEKENHLLKTEVKNLHSLLSKLEKLISDYGK
jgi:hypothetical protein